MDRALSHVRWIASRPSRLGGVRVRGPSMIHVHSPSLFYTQLATRAYESGYSEGCVQCSTSRNFNHSALGNGSISVRLHDTDGTSAGVGGESRRVLW